MAKEDKNVSLDLLGIKPVGDAAKTVIEKSLGGIGVFLGAVCVPALEEFGLLVRDEIRHWRLKNIIQILDKAQGKIIFEDEKLQIKAHPRVALSIIDNGSLNDNDEIQELWAGLFASSCTKDGQDDENLIFVDLLKQLTLCEARIFKYVCQNARKIFYENGLVLGDEIKIECKNLIKISGIDEVHRLDRELDHLNSLELINGGFKAEDHSLTAIITPTTLGLNLYSKTQGHNSDPKLYWNSNVITIQEKRKEDEEREKQEAERRRGKA